MTRQPARPFAGRKLTWRERRASQRRARQRAESLARSMPPPDRYDRVDPLTGKPLYLREPDRADSAAPSPTSRSATVPTGPAPRPASAATGRARRSAADLHPDVPPPRPPLPVRTALMLLVAGAALAAVSVMVGVGAGLPVLGHGFDPVLAGGGLVGTLVGVGLGWRSWRWAGPKPRVAVPAVALLLTTAFCVGVAGHPVVVNGHVLVATSRQARSARLAQQIYTDLRTMARSDDLLVAPIADARANVSAYDPAYKTLESLSARYADMPTSSLPDPAFGPVVASAKTAAYWGAEAMKTKASLINQDDARAETDLQTERATFTDTWLTCARRLQQVTATLGIPYTTDMEGPHE